MECVCVYVRPHCARDVSYIYYYNDGRVYVISQGMRCWCVAPRARRQLITATAAIILICGQRGRNSTTLAPYTWCGGYKYSYLFIFFCSFFLFFFLFFFGLHFCSSSSSCGCSLPSRRRRRKRERGERARAVNDNSYPLVIAGGWAAFFFLVESCVCAGGVGFSTILLHIFFSHPPSPFPFFFFFERAMT